MSKDITRDTKIDSITFVNGQSCSYTTTVGELLDEINQLGAFFLTNVGTYSTSTITSGKQPRAEIKPKGLTPDIRAWLSARMRSTK